MKNITLSNGRGVTAESADRGADTLHQANMADGGEMSETEWEEYCSILVKENAARIKRNRVRRERESAMKDCGLVKVRGALGGTYWE